MEIHFKHLDVEVPKAVQDRVDRKLTKLEELLGHAARNAHAYIEISRASGAHQNGQIWQAILNLDADGKRYNAHANGDSPHKASDKALYELRQEVRKARTKIHSQVKRSRPSWRSMFLGA